MCENGTETSTTKILAQVFFSASKFNQKRSETIRVNFHIINQIDFSKTIVLVVICRRELVLIFDYRWLGERCLFDANLRNAMYLPTT